MKLNLERFLPILFKLHPIFIRLLTIFIRSFPIFERFVTVFVSYLLERVFRAWKTEGWISDYRTRTVRISKFHYRIDIRVVLTEEQAKIILNDLVAKILELLKVG